MLSILMVLILLIPFTGASKMTKNVANPDLKQRNAIVSDVSSLLAADPEELMRDLLAMAWRDALKSEDPQFRTKLVNYLLDHAVSGTPFLKGQALKFLMDFYPADFDNTAIARIGIMPLTGDYGSETIRLIGISETASRIAELQDIAGVQWKEKGSARLYAGRQWSASLVLARFGKDEQAQRIIGQVKNEADIVIRATRLFADLAYTRHPLAFDALRSYLRSQERLPQVKSTVPGRPEAIYAAEMFALHAIGCPVQGPDLKEDDVTTIRKWADTQTEWQIR